MFGFLLSVIGTIEIIISMIVKIRNKKENKDFEEKNKKVINRLSEEYEYDEKTIELTEVKEQLYKAEKRLKEELPKERRKAILETELEYLKQTLSDTNLKILKLQEELQIESDADTNKYKEINQKIKAFLISENSKILVYFLVIIMALFYFVRILVDGIVVRFVSLICLALIFKFTIDTYSILKNKKSREIIFSLFSIIISLNYISVLITTNFYGFIPFIFLLTWFAWQGGKMSSILEYTLNLVVHFLVITMLVGAVTFQNYVGTLLVISLIIESVLIIINVFSIFLIYKKHITE
jgi:hypothetical protein